MQDCKNRPERLDKLLASSGLVTRSEARAAVARGRVTVDGVPARSPEQKVTREAALCLDGAPVDTAPFLYIMLNKPSGVLSAAKDPDCPTVVDLLPPELSRRGLFPAGRLDKDTTGLLIITDDGDFAHRLISPSHHVYKTYEATLESDISEEQLDTLRQGAVLGDGTECLPARLRKISDEPPTVRVQIREGKYHQVKRMFASVENSVVALRRTAIGALKLDSTLGEGEARLLTDGERKMIFSEAEII